MSKIKNLILISSLVVGIAGASIGYAADETAKQYVAGSTITANVKAKFLADSDIKSLHISVKTVKSTVTLTGKVNTDAEKAKAEQIAKDVNGVTEVKNKLVVSPNPQ